MTQFNTTKGKVPKIINKVQKFDTDLSNKNIDAIKIKLKNNEFFGPQIIYDTGFEVHTLSFAENFDEVGVLLPGQLLAVQLDAIGNFVNPLNINIPLKDFPFEYLPLIDYSIQAKPILNGYISATDRSSLAFYKGNYVEVYGDGSTLYKGEAPFNEKTRLTFDEIVVGGIAPNINYAKQVWHLKVFYNDGLDSYYVDGVLYGVKHDFNVTPGHCGPGGIEGGPDDFSRFEGYYTFQSDTFSNNYAANLDPISLTSTIIQAKGLVYDFVHTGDDLLCNETVTYHPTFETQTFNLVDLDLLLVEGLRFKLVSGTYVQQGGSGVVNIEGSWINSAQEVRLMGYHLMYDINHLWFFGVNENIGMVEGNERYNNLYLTGLPDTNYLGSPMLNLVLPYTTINFKRNPGVYPTISDVIILERFNRGGISSVFGQSGENDYIYNIFGSLYAYMPSTKKITILIPEYDKDYIQSFTTYETTDEFTTKERFVYQPEDADIFLKTRVMFNNAGIFYENKRIKKTKTT